MNRLKTFALVFAAICLLAIVPGVSRADTYVLDVGNPGASPPGENGPYGSVYVTYDSSAKTVTYELKATVGVDANRPIGYSDIAFNLSSSAQSNIDFSASNVITWSGVKFDNT